MVPSSGNSTGDLRKRKRRQLNRESAQRSRQRKQKRVDDLTAEIGRLSKENLQILSGVDETDRRCAAVEAENSVLNAQMTELAERLWSLTDILNHIDSAAGDGFLNGNVWDMAGFNHPIMASDEIFN